MGNSIRGEVLSVLRQLKWAVAGLGIGGLRDFPLSLDNSHCAGPPGERPCAGDEKAAPALAIPADPISQPPPEASSDGYPERSWREQAGSAAVQPLPRTDEEEAVRSSAGGGGAEALQAILEEMGDCKRCRLHAGRKNLVFADGSPSARLIFVGEGPGFDEDQQGLPFVGRAGKLLDKMILALGFQREEVYICNVVKCRPPNNRTPEKEEIEICSPFLFRQLDAISPKVICALGACAAQTLLGSSSPISRLRGKVHYRRGIPLICTFHPAYLLRNPAQKAAAWQDLLEVRGLINDEE